MIVIGIIMVAVVVLDAFLAAWFFNSVIAALTGGLLILGVVSLAFIASRRRRKNVTRGWSLGPAFEITDPRKPTKIADAVIASDILNLGFLAMGAAGAGKTESVALGYLDHLRAHAPGTGWTLADGKGDIDTYKKCVAMGCRPDYFLSSELPGSDSTNLFVGEAHDVVDRLSHILIGATASTRFYSDEQRTVLARVVPLLLSLPLPTNLRDLYVALTVDDAGKELLRRAQAAGADPTLINLASQWYDQDKRVQRISGLLNRLFVFVAGPTSDRLNAYQPDIDFSRAVADGRTIYLHLPLTDFARDVAVAIVEIFAVEARKRQLAGTDGVSSYPLLFDDWGKFFHEGFGPFSARARSAAMPLSFGFQSLAQLQAVSATYADELDDTIATKIVLRVQGNATARNAQQLLGEFDSIGLTTQRSQDRDSSSIGYTPEWRVKERDLRALQPGEGFVSTLIKSQDKMINPLWRVRFPLPDFKDWRSVLLPPPRTHPEGTGLGFWDRYMNPGTLKAIHHQIAVTVQNGVTARVVLAKQQSLSARARIAANPGLTGLNP